MTTVSEETLREEKEEEVPSDSGPETLRRQARTRASSVTPPSSVALQALTESGRVARRAGARAVALLDSPGSLAHSQPPTFAQARERHHECAGHFAAPVVRWLRLLWGYFHLLLVKPALNLAEWVTESPARFLITAVLVTVIWVWG